MSKLKWLYPGMKVKRWFLIMAIGIMIFSWGLALALKISMLDYLKLQAVKAFYLTTGKYLSLTITGLLVMLFGVVMIIIGIRQLNRSILSVIAPDDELVNVIYKKRYLEKGFKIVAIGGGTGLSTLLRGLKQYTTNLTAAVTVADDGGSSGKIRKELGVLPPGDLRNCLVALADSEPLMTKLFQYRFTDGSLEGQNLGNLLITAMSDISGDFQEALQEVSKVLKVRGRVLPSTGEFITLCAELEDGTIVEGESKISKSNLPIKRVFIKPFSCKPSLEILDALEEVDAIIIGPGSIYTSIMPNLIIEGLVDKIKKSRALKIYVCNVMTQPGETDNYTASDHIKSIFKHTGEKIFDYVIINNKIPHREVLKRYKDVNAHPVVADLKEVEKLGLKIIKGNFIDESNLVRHNPEKLAKEIIDLIFQKKILGK